MSVVESVPSQSFALDARKRTLQVGVLGCGTVGGGVVARLLQSQRIGREPARLARVLVRDLQKVREPIEVAEYLTTDPSAVVDDPSIDIVVETIGGVDAAHELVERALRNGKHVVTANKALIAVHGRALSRLARQYHVALRYEAAVGGAVPIVRAVAEAMAAEEILQIAGVMNGTSNFIVGEMAAGGSFADVLLRAQEAGYAEPDPSNDVDGNDAAHKLAVLSALGFRQTLDIDHIWRASLRGLTPADFQLAAALDCAIVPLALAVRRGEGLAAMVSPSFVPRDHDFARAQGPGNVIRVTGQDSGPLQFSGAGAGRVPTASAVFSDLAEIGHKMSRWEYLGCDPLPDEASLGMGVRLPVVVRVEAQYLEQVRQECENAGLVVRKVAANGLRCSECAVDEIAARIVRVLPSPGAFSLFPCFEIEAESTQK